MEKKLPPVWLKNLEALDIAFQPIINIHTARTYAVEALLRNYQDIGFKTIFDLFDQVYKEGLLYTFDLALREKTLKKFTHIYRYQDLKIFYNLDNRLFEMDDFCSGNTKRLLEKYNINKESICFEISERFEIKNQCSLEFVLRHYKDDGFCIAIDDFGIGYSGYKLLYDSTPNVIKIDRFFLKDIEKDIKKKLMVRNITHLAIQLGIKVIAEGIETKAEFLTCRDIGCHLAQGYLIQKPTKHPIEILPKYGDIADFVKFDERDVYAKIKIDSYIQKTKPIDLNSKMGNIVDYFKQHKNIEIATIINHAQEPVGIIQESKIKEFLYSPYGRSLLLNDTTKSKLKSFLSPCGHADIHSDISTIIELFSNNPESAGIIITKESKYYGFLSAKAIINIMHEQNLLYAREQNPLTKLPGNTMIERYIHAMVRCESTYMLVYFDLDNFKAFNDIYGFRNGDRIIQLFADILKKNLSTDYFKAHIGGDDFFVALKAENHVVDFGDIVSVVEKFINDAREFYTQEDKERGYIIAKDRDINEKKFPLLSVSASVLIVGQKTLHRSVKNINETLSLQKKAAKNDVKHLSISYLL
jgi:diguanylate cyclase (GGDEF)-like protein